MPISFSNPQAQFNIKITPNENDRNKIMVLLPKTKIIAQDSRTNAEITKTITAKTTRLEDDPMISSDGLIK